MKKIIVKEGKFKKLIKEVKVGYGNDDLDNLYDSIDNYLKEIHNAIGEHYSMVTNMNQGPNRFVVEIDNYLDGVTEIMNEWKEDLDISREENGLA